jgi:hypothetical protein
MKQAIKTIIWVGLFSIAMAYLESTLVVYLREIYGIKNLIADLPTQPDKFTVIEIGREFCTLVMLFCIGWIAGRTLQEKIAYSLMSFGIWDIFYYLWLYVFIRWPDSVFEWDILFLIPLPWWGPVWSPLLISVLMISGSIITILKTEKRVKISLKLLDWTILAASIFIGLYVFMEAAIVVLPDGSEAVAKVRPGDFNLILFLAAIAGFSLFCFRLARQKTQG